MDCDIYISDDTLEAINYAHKIAKLIKSNTGIRNILITEDSVKFNQDDGRSIVRFRL